MNRSFSGRLAAIFFAAYILIGACVEFYNVAWGTGLWRGEFSQTWFALFVVFVIFCAALFSLVNLFVWKREFVENTWSKAQPVIEKLGAIRYGIAGMVILLPAWLMQYSLWGVIFTGINIRVIVAFLAAFVSAALIFKTIFVRIEMLSILVLLAASLSVVDSLSGVYDYPFSLGWSEGNRMWDYSVMFGRDLYDFPQDQNMPVLLEPARQFIGGLPFLIPGLTIWMERLWVGLMLVFPYLFVGFGATRAMKDGFTGRVLVALFIAIFIRQGPVHTPLLISAAVVALAWGGKLWLSIPMVMLAGYYAQESRFSWLFAPGMWIVMLEFASASTLNGKIDTATWKRAAALGFAGIFGGYALPKALPFLHINVQSLEDAGDIVATSGITPDRVVHEVTHQNLLWYRLLPNPTFETGILLGLLLAVGPLLFILYYLAAKNYWKLNFLQKCSIVLPLLAFFVVGLAASAKIGGGGDLHNMDMFIIGSAFAFAIAWKNGGRNWLLNEDGTERAKWVAVLVLVIPALWTMPNLYSINYGSEAPRLVTLTDAPDEASLGMLPSREKTDEYLAIIQYEVDAAKMQGDILFMDQRQLLTFGFITNVPFIPEYEKKFLMNEALSEDASYFAPFYVDIKSQRFSLIVSEPLRRSEKGSGSEFGEENDAWVQWVSNPVRCYYEPIHTFKDARTQLLSPIEHPEDCADVFPIPVP